MDVKVASVALYSRHVLIPTTGGRLGHAYCKASSISHLKRGHGEPRSSVKSYSILMVALLIMEAASENN